MSAPVVCCRKSEERQSPVGFSSMFVSFIAYAHVHYTCSTGKRTHAHMHATRCRLCICAALFGVSHTQTGSATKIPPKERDK